jgi:hypothetical protein
VAVGEAPFPSLANHRDLFARFGTTYLAGLHFLQLEGEFQDLRCQHYCSSRRTDFAHVQLRSHFGLNQCKQTAKKIKVFLLLWLSSIRHC